MGNDPQETTTMSLTKGDIIRHLEAASGNAMNIDPAIPQAAFEAIRETLERMGAEDTHPHSHFVGTLYMRSMMAPIGTKPVTLLPMTPTGWEVMQALGEMLK